MSVMNRNHLVFRQIVDRIEADIARGRLLPGERLPSERKWMEQLRTSRSSVREAFRVLEENGSIEIKRGRSGGAFIRASAKSDRGAPDRLVIDLSRVSLDHIAEFRQRIEGNVTELAAERANAADIRVLKPRLQSAKRCMSLDTGRMDAFIEADKSIHLAIAAIAGNPLFVESLKATLGMKRYFCRFLRLNPSLMAANMDDLCAIVAAMEIHNARRAGDLVCRHISRFNGLEAIR